MSQNDQHASIFTKRTNETDLLFVRVSKPLARKQREETKMDEDKYDKPHYELGDRTVHVKKRVDELAFIIAECVSNFLETAELNKLLETLRILSQKNIVLSVSLSSEEKRWFELKKRLTPDPE